MLQLGARDGAPQAARTTQGVAVNELGVRVTALLDRCVRKWCPNKQRSAVIRRSAQALLRQETRVLTIEWQL